MSNSFRSSFIESCRSAISKASAVADVSHLGLRGTFRELLVTHMLRPALPPEVRIASGQLTSADGILSPQIDVVLYSPGILPPVLVNENTGLFPAESCLYTIEVKSQLNSSRLRDAIVAARAVRALPLIDTDHFFPDSKSQPPRRLITGTAHPISALFAFGSDLKTDPSGELTRYRKLDESADQNPALSVICIYGRGYWFASNGRWRYMPPSEDLSEVLAFLAGVANTVPQLLVAKGRPRFGHYLIDENSMRDA